MMQRTDEDAAAREDALSAMAARVKAMENQTGRGITDAWAMTLAGECLLGLDGASYRITKVPALFEQRGLELTVLGFEVGKWTEEVRHADPCDCDEDNETVGDRCITNSVWFWALLRDEGGFAPSLAFPLSDPIQPGGGEGVKSE